MNDDDDDDDDGDDDVAAAAMKYAGKRISILLSLSQIIFHKM